MGKELVQGGRAGLGERAVDRLDGVGACSVNGVVNGGVMGE